MDEVALKKFLAENLKVEVDKGIGMDGSITKLTVKLFLCGEEISSDYQTFKEPE